MSAPLASALALSLVAIASTAAAQPPRPVCARLSWASAEPCIGEERLVSSVEQRLGRDVFGGDGCDLELRGEVGETSDGHWRMHAALDVGGEAVGTREVTSERASCSELDEAIAVVVALLVDVDREEIALMLPVEPASSSAPPSTAARAAPWSGGARIDLGAIVGPLPSIAPIARLIAWLGPPGPFSIEIEAGHSLESGRAIEGGEVIGVLRWAGLAVCLDGSVIESIAVGGCVRLEGGVLEAWGRGLESSSQGGVPWIAGVGGARARFRLARMLELVIGVDVIVPIARDRFVVVVSPGSTMVAHEAGPIGGRGSLSLGFALPE
jgi:hypothetical protein